MIVFSNNTKISCTYIVICTKIKTALPVYFLLPLSIDTFHLHHRTSSIVQCADSYNLNERFVTILLNGICLYGIESHLTCFVSLSLHDLFNGW